MNIRRQKRKLPLIYTGSIYETLPNVSAHVLLWRVSLAERRRLRASAVFLQGYGALRPGHVGFASVLLRRRVRSRVENLQYPEYPGALQYVGRVFFFSSVNKRCPIIRRATSSALLGGYYSDGRSFGRMAILVQIETTRDACELARLARLANLREAEAIRLDYIQYR